MYQLQVFHPGASASTITVTTTSATEVLGLIPKLLKEHPTCDRVVVTLGATILFAVDCHGQTISP